MKGVFGEYYKIIMYTIFGILIILSSYTIILNIHHYKSLKNTAIVSDIDTSYKKFMNNVTKLEDYVNLNNSKANSKYFKNTLNVLKKDGLFRLVLNSKLTYSDLYNLNDYFIDGLINEGWVTNIKQLDTQNKYKDEIDFLVNNAKYLKNYLAKNGLILYDESNTHKIVDDYNLILNNYAMYSSIILKISGGYND